MASQAHGEPITGSSLTASPFSTKKKKKNTESEIEPNQPITSLAPGITSRRRWLVERSIPNKKANQTQNSASQTQSTEVFIKKKKKSPIHKPKSNPVNHLPTNGHVAAVVAAVSSSSLSSFAWSPLIADRRSENGERRSVFGVRRSVLPPALRQGISFLFLSDSFSVSSSLIFSSVFLSVFSTSPSCRSIS